MTQRTTFALDRETVRRLRRLAGLWRVSQAEVVRRAVARAEEKEAAERSDATTLLERLHQSGHGMVREKAEKYLAQVRSARGAWRGA